MKPNLALLRADVLDELDKVEKITAAMRSVADKLDLPPEDVGLYDRGAIGYLIHGFYNGCENVFRAIAAYFENDVAPDSWHADLLRRMTLEIPGYRPAVIDDELFALLNDFRGFRHVSRNAYSFELDWERERLVAKRLDRAAALLQQQVRDFLTRVPEDPARD